MLIALFLWINFVYKRGGMGALAYLKTPELKDKDMLSQVLFNLKEKKLALKKLLTEKSFNYSQEPKFPLASGRKSRFYIDCKMTTLYSQGAFLIGQILFDLIKPLNIKGIGGLTLGADAIAVATAVIAGQNGVDLVSFVIRKEAKKHGLMKYVEGDVNPEDKVVIIDDVITTGGSTLQAIEKAEKAGLKVVKVIVLVDREEGGRENIEHEGYEVKSVFTKSELKDEYEKLNK